jgi:hypothetical protein
MNEMFDCPVFSASLKEVHEILWYYILCTIIYMKHNDDDLLAMSVCIDAIYEEPLLESRLGASEADRYHQRCMLPEQSVVRYKYYFMAMHAA